MTANPPSPAVPDSGSARSSAEGSTTSRWCAGSRRASSPSSTPTALATAAGSSGGRRSAVVQARRLRLTNTRAASGSARLVRCSRTEHSTRPDTRSPTSSRTARTAPAARSIAAPGSSPATCASSSPEALNPTCSSAASSCRATAAPSPAGPSLAGTRSALWTTSASSIAGSRLVAPCRCGSTAEQTMRDPPGSRTRYQRLCGPPHDRRDVGRGSRAPVSNQAAQGYESRGGSRAARVGVTDRTRTGLTQVHSLGPRLLRPRSQSSRRGSNLAASYASGRRSAVELRDGMWKTRVSNPPRRSCKDGLRTGASPVTRCAPSPGLEPGASRLTAGRAARCTSREWTSAPSRSRTCISGFGGRCLLRWTTRAWWGGCPSRIRTSVSAFRARCPCRLDQRAPAGYRVSDVRSRPRARTWPCGFKVRRAADYTNRDRATRAGVAGCADGRRRWSLPWESNPVPPVYWTGALPVELERRGAVPGSRTPTGLALNQLPLPVGLEPRGFRGGCPRSRTWPPRVSTECAAVSAWQPGRRRSRAHDGTRTRDRRIDNAVPLPPGHVSRNLAVRRPDRRPHRPGLRGRWASNPLLRFGRPTCPPSSPRPRCPLHRGDPPDLGCPGGVRPACPPPADLGAVNAVRHVVRALSAPLWSCQWTADPHRGSVRGRARRREDSNPRETVLETVPRPLLADSSEFLEHAEIESRPIGLPMGGSQA